MKTIVEELASGDRLQGSELINYDVGRWLDHDHGFGRVLSADVGKRVWYQPGVGLIMENAEQRDRRKNGHNQ